MTGKENIDRYVEANKTLIRSKRKETKFWEIWYEEEEKKA